MIDFHSHVIPHIDDGSKSFEMSFDMLKLACEEGTRYICATSHFIPGEVEISAEDYNDRLTELISLSELAGIDIDILPAVEIYIDPELPRLYKENKVWGINNTKYLLIELPMQDFPVYTENIFYELRLQGAVPVIAHPERNFRIMKDYKLLENLVEQGALAQLNAGSLRGIYGRDIKSFAEKLVDMNLIHMVGSDAHDDKRRTAKISDALSIIQKRNYKLYEWIMDNEEKVIRGLPLEILSINHKHKRKSLLSLLKNIQKITLIKFRTR
jgi:protein-tyrosine phosphatase